jgi:SprT protein
LKDGIALAEKAYNTTFKFPNVTYTKRGEVAGTASYSTWTIDLNAHLLMEHIEEFIERTVPHELAHLITDQVYPESHNPVRTSSWKRVKREPHGSAWRSVCTTIGMTDVTRCHDYDTTNTKIVKSNGRQIEWKCSCCGTVLKLTPAKSAKLIANPDALWHRGCARTRLVKVGTSPVTTPVQRPFVPVAAPAQAPAKSRAPVAPTQNVGLNKLDTCKRLYVLFHHLTRGEIIAKFISTAGCTPAGANTYYATCKRLHG